MIVKEIELMESFRDLNLGVILTLYSLGLNQISMMSDFKNQIAQAQKDEEDFLRTMALVEEVKLKDFTQDTDGL